MRKLKPLHRIALTPTLPVRHHPTQYSSSDIGQFPKAVIPTEATDSPTVRCAVEGPPHFVFAVVCSSAVISGKQEPSIHLFVILAKPHRPITSGNKG
jgi:hypothetical protein